MTSPADRFSRLQKVAIFLIALGQERTREILADVDLDTVERLNAAIASLGPVTPEERAGVMLEFAHFFYDDRSLAEGKASAAAPPKPAGKGPKPRRTPASSHLDLSGKLPAAGKEPQTPLISEEEQAILKTLDRLRRRLDPRKIDWGRAGYDFGEGFRGPGGDRR